MASKAAKDHTHQGRLSQYMNDSELAKVVDSEDIPQEKRRDTVVLEKEAGWEDDNG